VKTYRNKSFQSEKVLIITRSLCSQFGEVGLLLCFSRDLARHEGENRERLAPVNKMANYIELSNARIFALENL